MNPLINRSLFASALVCTALTIAHGCSPGPGPLVERTDDRIPEEEILWPSPPDPPKIAYVTTFRGTADLHEKRSFLDSLGRLMGVRGDEKLVRPTGVAVDGDLLAVADPGKAALFVFDRRAGKYTKIVEGDEGPLVSPVGVAFGNNATVYLSDSEAARIHEYDEAGRLRATWGKGGLGRPSGIAFDRTLNRLYVADAARHRVVVYDEQGNELFQFGHRGLGDGEFNFPSHVHVDDGRRVYVVDSLNFRVQTFRADGTFVSTFGRAGDVSGDIARPKGIASDSNGNLYLVDALFDSVQIFDGDGEFLLAFGRRGVGPGEMWLPTGLAIDGKDRIYVADSHNHRIHVFRFLAGN